jgi:nucleoside-diphosphate kinase
MNYSFIMLKPDCLERQLTGSIIERLRANQINIEIFDYRLVSEEIIYKHYAEKIDELGDVFKEKTRKGFAGKYVIPVIVSSDSNNLIPDIRKAVGATDPSKAEPGTIRGDFGTDSFEKAMQENRVVSNLIHASDSYETYLAEARLWFGEDITKRYE